MLENTGSGMAADQPDAVVRVARRGRLGHIELNRPQAINALTHGMIRILHAVLADWADDPGVETVLLSGAGDRGLCAGGDVVALRQDAIDGDEHAVAAFWADEYRLNARIAEYPKPYVALMDGLVLGGGVGVSAHGSHRVVTDRSRIGLPETGIGFVPDVGSTRLLARAPGESGTWAALTGELLGGADAIDMGLADTLVPAARLDELVRALESDSADAVLRRFAQVPPLSRLDVDAEARDAAFAGDDAAAIVDRLEQRPEPAFREMAERIRGRSPRAVAVTLASLRRAADEPDLATALRREYRVSLDALRSPDFAEGIRAQLVDRDREPRWSPETLEGVLPGDVEAAFETADGFDDLDLGAAAQERSASASEPSASPSE